MEKNSKIYVAGHRGLVGSAIVRALTKAGYSNLVTRTRQELDLLDQKSVAGFFATEKPEYVFDAAAKVGGIMANKTYPAEFISQNLRIQSNIIDSAHENKVTKLLFLGSSCIYPRLSQQPIKEEYLMTGMLEPTNDAYGTAKIAGIMLCQSYHKQFGDNFICVMPTNLYGANDNYDAENSHLVAALISKFYEAKKNNASSLTLWGTGAPRRECLLVDDMASACIHLMQTYNEPEIVNIGTGEDVSIKELSEMMKKISGWEGEIIWDSTRPDGMPRKLLDVSKLTNLGWKYSVNIEDGIRSTYEAFVKNKND